MRSLRVAFVLCTSLTAAAPTTLAQEAAAQAGPPAPVRLHVRDGQLLSHTFPVFVTADIEPGMKPVLRFAGAHLVTGPGQLERDGFAPALVAPHQLRTLRVGEADVQVTGTLMLFELPERGIPAYKSAVRLLPSVEWTVAGADGAPASTRRVVAEREIYLGNMAGAALWTALTVAAIGALLLTWSSSKRARVTSSRPWAALLLVTGPDGYLSLWRTQLLLWTLAVGSLVFLFGLVQVQVPDIPETLVTLMGMSLLTGLVANKIAADAPAAGAQAGAAPGPAPAAPPAPAAMQPQASDLITSWNPARQRVEFSLPKAQMVFWTALILVLFFVKSILDGALWAVPWQIVALTGFSQTGYVGDKLVGARP